MQPGWEVSEVWDPILEANPLDVSSSTRDTIMSPSVVNAACRAKPNELGIFQANSGGSIMPPSVVNTACRAKPIEPDKPHALGARVATPDVEFQVQKFLADLAAMSPGE